MLAGVDPRDLTTNPVSAADEAALLVTPPRLPAELGEALRAAWRRVGPPGRLVTADGPGLGGARSTELLEEPAEAEHHHGGDHGHAHHDGHGGMSHDEMMEVRGDPSADGLVMEDIDTVVGPIFAGLPAGLRPLGAGPGGGGVLGAPGPGGIAARGGGAAVDARAGSVWYEPLGFRV